MFRVVALALAVSGLCLGSSARADQAEEKAIAYVEKLGGTVFRDNKSPGRPVATVILRSAKVRDAGLKELAELKNLTALVLSETRITDAGLKALQQALPDCKIRR